MDQVTVRELRNHGGRVLDRVSRGETLVVTRAGLPIAELRPLPRPPLSSTALLERWRRLPAIDREKLRQDVDAVLDPAL